MAMEITLRKEYEIKGPIIFIGLRKGRHSTPHKDNMGEEPTKWVQPSR